MNGVAFGSGRENIKLILLKEKLFTCTKIPILNFQTIIINKYYIKEKKMRIKKKLDRVTRIYFLKRKYVLSTKLVSTLCPLLLHKVD